MLTPLIDPHSGHRPAHVVTLHWLAFWTDPDAVAKVLREADLRGPTWSSAMYGAEAAVAVGIAGRVIGVKIPEDIVGDVGPQMIAHLEIIRDNFTLEHSKRLLNDCISWIRRTYL